MRHWLYPILLFFGFSIADTAQAESPKQILLVVSSHGRDEGKTQPGFEMDELAQAYMIFKANGFALDIASPDGGAVVADKFNAGKTYNAAFLADPVAMTQLGQTFSTSAIRAADYSAIFIIGGKGAMFDLPKDAALHKLVADMYARNAVVAAVCHGPAALVGVRMANGEMLVAGRAVTGFSNEEEKMFGEQWVKQFPFLLETALRDNGARFGKADIMLPHVEIDGRLITGQNPYSVSKAAEAVIKAMGQAPVSRELWTDERSMELVAKVLRGEREWGAHELATRKNAHDIPLIAIWGYYKAISVGNDKAGLRMALSVMDLAEPYFPEPQLKTAIADARRTLASSQR